MFTARTEPAPTCFRAGHSQGVSFCVLHFRARVNAIPVPCLTRNCLKPLNNALHLLEPGALPARQLLRELYDVANFPANYSGLKKRGRREDCKPHFETSANKSAGKSAASLAPAVVSAGFRVWDVVQGVTEVGALITG